MKSDIWNEKHRTPIRTNRRGNSSGNIKLSLGNISVEAKEEKTVYGLLLAGVLAVWTIIWWTSENKKSENDNKTDNDIRKDNNASNNRIKEDNARTDNELKLMNSEYEQKNGHEILKHEQWMQKQEYKSTKTCTMLPEIASHELLSSVGMGPVTHGLNYYCGNEVQEAQALYDNLIFENETAIIFSPTNVGKTLVSLQIGAAISERFADLHTLYYNQEMNDSQIQKLLYTNKEQSKYPENMEIISEVHNEGELIKNLLFNIEKHRKNMLICIDNITDIHPSSKNEKSTEFLKNLKKIRSNAKRIYGINLTFIIVCHTNKNVKNEWVEINDLKGNGNLSNFADRVIAVGKVPNHNDKRYLRILKGRNGITERDVAKIYKIVDDEKPRIKYIGDAKKEDILSGKYKEPKVEISNDVAKKWYYENLHGKGYGTIAREYFNLTCVKKDDSAEEKERKKSEFEKSKNKVRNEIEKYKKSLNPPV